MAVQTNDAVLLPITFVSWKILREFTYEDNFNNTFLLKKYSSLQIALQSYGKASTKVIKDVLKDKFMFIDSVFLCWST